MLTGGGNALRFLLEKHDMRNLLGLMVLTLSFACATNQSNQGPEPDITIIQLSRVAEGTQNDTGPVSAHYAVDVKNTLAEPIQLRRVALQSIGGGAYTLPAYSQGFSEAIAAGETKRVSFWAPAYVAMESVAGANGPVTLRGTLEFSTANRKFQTIVVQNIAPAGGN
jgi:hypothetical protein